MCSNFLGVVLFDCDEQNAGYVEPERFLTPEESHQRFKMLKPYRDTDLVGVYTVIVRDQSPNDPGMCHTKTMVVKMYHLSHCHAIPEFFKELKFYKNFFHDNIPKLLFLFFSFLLFNLKKALSIIIFMFFFFFAFLLNQLDQIKLYDYYVDVNHLYLLLDHCEGGTVWTNAKKKGLREEVVKDIANDVLNVLACMHEKWYVHGDIKPENIVLSAKKGVSMAYVIDFGQSIQLEPNKRFYKSSGTWQYFSPERTLGRNYPLSGEEWRKADLWALGIVLFELLVGKRWFGSVLLELTVSSINVEKYGQKKGEKKGDVRANFFKKGVT
ncbi:hypothetical protein RFI_02552 [Reticulomyxa filosa]|uniref:Protein kinase domain-containing protein n=1 Tax=Reticulomyxa filosa TaxID=46433 RepID=X6P8V4_RETFI|nr:hypothetical protein RFI_02552 [Reticulomyxa filosa]|eukprot:ETO34543.1 hypothetical protein RFI_02552 [Reticulomyxa filosa]